MTSSSVEQAQPHVAPRAHRRSRSGRFLQILIAITVVLHVPVGLGVFELARRLSLAPAECVAVEDSHNGIRSAKAAGMACIAIPNPHFPPGEAAVAR